MLAKQCITEFDALELTNQNNQWLREWL